MNPVLQQPGIREQSYYIPVKVSYVISFDRFGPEENEQ